MTPQEIEQLAREGQSIQDLFQTATRLLARLT